MEVVTLQVQKWDLHCHRRGFESPRTRMESKQKEIEKILRKIDSRNKFSLLLTPEQIRKLFEDSNFENGNTTNIA